MLLRQRQISIKVNFLLIYASQNAIFVSECLEDACLVKKNGSILYLGNDGVKELVIICDYVHFFCKNEWTQDCF